MSTDYLTIEQIKATYPNQWVLIDRPKVDQQRHVLGGRVLIHTPDRDEFDRKLGEIGDTPHVAVRYTGEPDPDEVFLSNLEL